MSNVFNPRKNLKWVEGLTEEQGLSATVDTIGGWNGSFSRLWLLVSEISEGREGAACGGLGQVFVLGYLIRKFVAYYYR